jgi:hypothetical protein
VKKLILSILIATACLNSCKEEEVIPLGEDKLNLLTSKIWKPSMTNKNSKTNPLGDFMYHATLSCELDDSYQFDTRNKLTIVKGQDQCNVNEASSETTDYSITADAKQLTINGKVYMIAEISATQLKFYAVLPPFSGGNLIYLFEH